MSDDVVPKLRHLREVLARLAAAVGESITDNILDDAADELVALRKERDHYAMRSAMLLDRDLLRALLADALPVIEAHTPPLSTSGTMVSLRDRIRAALAGGAEPKENDRA